MDTVFFDMDGTLIDTEKYYNVCWCEAIAKFGYTITKEEALDLRSLGRPHVYRFFEEKYGINLQIKAPNDIYYNEKKVGGILTESKIVGQKTKYIVVGIGINTNGKNFSDDIRNIATSIKKEFNIDVDNLFIVNEFCKIFEKRLMKRIEE